MNIFQSKEEGIIQALVTLHNYRYPRSNIESGNYAIIVFDVIQLLEGEIPAEIKKDQIIVTGHMPKIIPGETYYLTAKLVKDRQHGLQFESISIRLNYNMNNESDQRKFLSFFMTDRQINLLYSNFANPISLLENKNIGQLIKIKGIGPATAKRMCLKYEDCKDNGRAYVELQALDLTKKAIDKLVERYGSPDLVVEKVLDNPYILIKEVRGYGWKKADELALKQGFTRDCKPRVLAYARYYLEEQGDANGNSWVTISDLLQNVYNECTPVLIDDLKNWIKEMIVTEDDFDEYYEMYRNDVVPDGFEKFLYYEKSTKQIGLLKTRVLEKEISRHLIRLQEGLTLFNYDKDVCDYIIKQVEEEQGYEFTDEQKKAIWKILDNTVSILTGSAGTGKSTSMIAVTRILQYYNQKVDQCALSGRASSNLTEITNVEGKTIHRLLRYTPEQESFAFSERHPMNTDAVVLDEVSMVGGELFLSLISAIPTGAKLIMIGDPNQLESIGLCNILKDCIQSGYLAVAALSKIHRQAARSGIIINANLACTGQSLCSNRFTGVDIRGELQDFKLVSTTDPDIVAYKMVEEFKDLYLNQHIPAEDIQLIVPMRLRGNISCRELNNIIQDIVNPFNEEKAVTLPFSESGMTYSVKFKPGDRIIVNHNDYHALNSKGEEVSIFNGNIGYIVDISTDSMVIKLKDQGEVILDRDSWFNIQLGYTITVHKLQGSSAPYVIFGLNTSSWVLLSKELVYTALTRAKKYCICVTQPNIINQAIHTSKVKLKQTWLKADLHNQYLLDIQESGGF